MTVVNARGAVASLLYARAPSTLLRRLAVGCGSLFCAVSPMLAQADDITYGYDALDRLTSVTVSGATAYYDYDAAGNITAIRRQGALSVAAPVNRTGSLPAPDAGDLPVPTAPPQASAR